MNTYLGAANALTPDDIDPAYIQDAKVVYQSTSLGSPKMAAGTLQLRGTKVALRKVVVRGKVVKTIILE